MSLANKPTQTEQSNFEGIAFEVVEEECTQEGKKIQHKGVYLVPNAITTVALLAGFYAIIAGMNGEYKHAVAAIFIAALLDGLDGRVARAMNAQSPFGEQFDSLSDMLAFGVAPAILMYNWTLSGLGRIGLACCFIYTACAAFRLARFNVQIGTVDKRYFIGVASPLAAIVVISTIWAGLSYQSYLEKNSVQIALASLMVTLGLLMVSNLKYYSFKQMDKKRVPFIMMIPVVFILAAMSYNIPMGLLILALCYIISGFVTSIMAKK